MAISKKQANFGSFSEAMGKSQYITTLKPGDKFKFLTPKAPFVTRHVFVFDKTKKGGYVSETGVRATGYVYHCLNVKNPQTKTTCKHMLTIKF